MQDLQDAYGKTTPPYLLKFVFEQTILHLTLEPN